MKQVTRSMMIVLVFVGFLLSACGAKSATSEKVLPSKLEQIEGTDLSRIILTEKAADRIGIQTASTGGTTIPYAAIIYDIEGNTWIYTNPEPLTFVRELVMIDRIEGDTAVLAESLPSALNVVTVGVAELWGTETGVSK
jgi:hypothetical protein